MTTKKSVLLIVDAFDLKSSGGRAARQTSEYLKKMGYHIFIISTIIPLDFNEVNNEFTYLTYKKGTISMKVNDTIVRKTCPAFFKDLSINFIHLCPMGARVNLHLISCAIEAKIKIIAQFWGYDYYCIKPFALRNSMHCNKCANGNILNSFLFKCDSFPKLIYKSISRIRRINILKQFNYYLVPNNDLVDALELSGVNRNNILKTPLPFYSDRVLNLKSQDGNNVVFYGQTIESKGFNLLPEIIKLCPNIPFVIAPMVNTKAGLDTINKLQLLENVQIIEKQWHEGLSEIVANARIVLFPSLWATTTETALLEAIFLEKVVAVFDVGVHKELFDNTLMSSKFLDIESMANSIRSLYYDNTQYEISKKNILNIKASLFDYHKQFEDFKLVYS
jgi:glycosyl transferase family 1